MTVVGHRKKPPNTHKKTRMKSKNTQLLISGVLFNLSRKESQSAYHMYGNFGEVFVQVELVGSGTFKRKPLTLVIQPNGAGNFGCSGKAGK